MVNDLRNTHLSFFTTLLLSLAVLCSAPASARKKKDNTSVPAKDTFKVVNRYIEKKKYRKANKLLKKYNKAHPNNLNALWLQARANLFASNNKKSDVLYKAALQAAPKNDYLKLDYIHSLADMGKSGDAETLLTQMENTGSDYADLSILRARLAYYRGDYKTAEAYIKKALLQDSQNPNAIELNELIELAHAFKVSLNAFYLSDNQPLQFLNTTIKAEKAFNPWLAPSITGQNFHFMKPGTADAPWIKVNNKTYFSKVGMRLDYGAGVVRFPSGNKTSFTGMFNLNQRISQSFNLDLGVDHSPYFGNKATIDTNITTTQVNAALNFHKNNWQAQAAFMNNQYPRNNNVYSVYGWALAPVVVFPQGVLQLGVSGSYSNSNDSRFISVSPLSEILLNAPTSSIAGVYSPYFTPNNQYIAAALLSFSVKASKNVSIYINGDYGYGTIMNPYLYLDRDQAGAIIMKRDFSKEQFNPFSASFAINCRLAKTWSLNAKYTYRSTYFFNSNYAGIGLEKSFLPRRNKHDVPDNKKSAYAKKIKDIENKLALLYRTKNNKDLKQGVDDVKNQITNLRNALQQKLNTSEITPGSDKAAAMQDKISSLNDMIEEIDDVSLADGDNATNKKDWLVNKQRELASIRYSGSLEDE